MASVQQKIVNEILDEYKNREDVLGICVFGSVAVGKERKDSDVDITVIFDSDREWGLLKEKRYGIAIDLEITTKNSWEMMLREYPYLFFIENNRILLDKTGFIRNIMDKSTQYFNNNPDAYSFWKREYDLMRELKISGKKPKNFIDVCDEAEIRFSDHHSVRRNVLTTDFFHKHVEK